MKAHEPRRGRNDARVVPVHQVEEFVERETFFQVRAAHVLVAGAEEHVGPRLAGVVELAKAPDARHLEGDPLSEVVRCGESVKEVMVDFGVRHRVVGLPGAVVAARGLCDVSDAAAQERNIQKKLVRLPVGRICLRQDHSERVLLGIGQDWSAVGVNLQVLLGDVREERLDEGFVVFRVFEDQLLEIDGQDQSQVVFGA